LPAQTRDANHVELVEVGAEDRKKFQSLEERVAFIERLVKNPRVEFEPAQLAIYVELGISSHVPITR